MATYFIDFNGNVLPIVPADFRPKVGLPERKKTGRSLGMIPERSVGIGSNTSIPQWFELSEIQHAHQTILAQIAQKTHMNQQLEREVTLILGMLVSLYIVFHLLYFVLIVACCTQRRISRR